MIKGKDNTPGKMRLSHFAWIEKVEHSYKILVLEESLKHAAVVIEQLEQRGFGTVVQTVKSQKAMQEAIAKRDWDMVIAIRS